jgi:tetratricopeptide (TPR) repeat protein
LAIEADQPQALFGLARIDLLRGDDDAAVARLRGLMATHPEMTSGAGLLAQVFERRGETAQAAAMTQWSRQKPEPPVPDPWMDALLADCYDTLRLSLKFEEDFQSGQIEQAMPLLHRVEELDPQSPIPQLLRGWTYARDHHDEEAVQEYRKALEKGGDAEKICPYLVQSLLALGRVKEAAMLLADYSAKKPDSIPILIAYADVAVRQGDTGLARTLLSKVILKEPYLYAANVNLAKILWAAGDRDNAAQCLVRITEVSATDVAARAQLAEYYLGKADPVAAIAPLEQAVAIEHTQESVHQKITSMLYLAYLQAGGASEGRGGQALDFVEKAIRLMPDQPSAYAVKAGLCAQSKQYPGAADALGKLESLQPANPTVYLSLGDVLYEEGNASDARRNWQKALDLTSANDAGLRTAIANRLKGPITEDTFR